MIILIICNPDLIPTAASRRYEEWLPGPRQLTALRVKARLYPGFKPSITDLLVQGNPRTCTLGRRGRAQALMSSLGVTDWFQMVNFNCSDDDPVLGMYPLRFVTEAARKTGAQFCLTTDVGPHWQDILIILEQELNGTMLPFRRFDLAETAMRGTITCCYNLTMCDHPTLSS